MLRSISSLSTLNLLVGLAVGVTSYWICWVLWARFFHPLRNIPGPWLASVSRIWIVHATLRGDMDETQRALHRRYGPLVRIAPHELCCADPDAIKVLYSTQAPFVKSDFYTAWGTKSLSKYRDLFSEVDPKLHSQRRRIVNSIYSLSSVLQCEGSIDKCIDLFIAKMDGIAENHATIDMSRWLQWFAFDVIGQLFFGEMFGFMQGAHDHNNYITDTDSIMPVLLTSAVSPSYVRSVFLMSSLLVRKVRYGIKASIRITQAARRSVEKAIDNDIESSSGRTLLRQFLDVVREKGEKVDFGMDEVVLECWGGFVAGSDTTAIALRATLYNLMTNPTVYRDLQAEIDEADRRGLLSGNIRYDEAIRLPYLCACIKEAMRLHPSVGLAMPRIIPSGGHEIAGTFIPQGYVVGMNAAVVQYDKSVFGEDADQYRPARWLQKDTVRMDKTMIVFGAGTRTCIGQNISVAEIYKLVPQIIRHFELGLAPDAKWRSRNHWFHKQTGLRVQLQKRTHERDR